VAIAHVNFIPWGDYIQNWVGNTLNQAKSNGWVPMITVMPIADGQTPNQFNNAYALSTFARGDHDVQARIWAQTLKGYGDPVLFRFAHDFNHGAYGWDIRNNGQTAQQYIDAWRHIHDVFIQEGATNVLWVWSPNVNWDGVHTFTEAYPGDAYVDWLGLDGYNWEGVNNTAAQTFHQIFDNSYNQITAISLKPLMIAETASHEVGIVDGIHKKAVWITSAFGDTGISSLPRIKAVVWYNYNYDNAIWVINSSPESKNAFAQAVCQVPIRQHF
jgi:mannan endo-1,4-beta-mannosidase